ncbi:MAG TPA: hypothetical protein PLB30_02090 [Thermoleophilia bacterium]|nr:hypothetical protein [Thermoleophilia bacterium]HQG03090.1 hypothetical protein [Thermoleophilia bacterium]HQG54337.1 hypothetical protein [Thermoleophilia bacterium]HQJ97331.1 hypothetical protein [Thermoleophilia bacterium]
MSSADDQASGSGQNEIDFFGMKLKVANPRLAALLNSDVNESVVVIGRRTFDLLAGAGQEDGLEPPDDVAGHADEAQARGRR